MPDIRHLIRARPAMVQPCPEALGSSNRPCTFNVSSKDKGTLYYFRYLHCFQLKRWQGTARDTARNLKLFDFVRRHAERQEDQENLEKWRPYVVRMNAVARAMIELENHDHAKAIAIIEEAAQTIESLPERDEETFQFERNRSLMALREMAVRIGRTSCCSASRSLPIDIMGTSDNRKLCKLRTQNLADESILQKIWEF